MTEIKNVRTVLAKANIHSVNKLAKHVWEVTSGREGDVYYVTEFEGRLGMTCSCPWGSYRPQEDTRSACSHTLAVLQVRADLKDFTIKTWRSKEEALRQHRPYTEFAPGVWVTWRTRTPKTGETF